ncbi:MAG: hypothetical protein LBM59_07115 [Ruminococcus sp.]|nr:hypothetical protein [Ruminococcus sp.]
MKKFLAAILATAIIAVTTACGGTATTAVETTTAATTAATTTVATTTAATTEAETAQSTAAAIFPAVAYCIYTEDEVAEIIKLDGNQTDAVKEMNDDIDEKVYGPISAFELSYNSIDDYPMWLDAYAYSFTDDVYIQIYNTIGEFPAYGYAGQLFGFVYDITNDNYVTLEEVLENNGITKEELEQEITDRYIAIGNGDYIEDVDVKAFRYTWNGVYYDLSYLFELTVIHAGEEDMPHQMFWQYTPEFNEIIELNPSQLFDPSDVDVYDHPPLHGNEGYVEDFGETYTADISPTGHLSGRYYLDGDTVAVSFEFGDTAYVDSYYGSGSYETTFGIQLEQEVGDEDENGNAYFISYFKMYDDNGDLAFVIVAPQNNPDIFELYTAEEEYFGTFYKLQG